MATQAWQPGQLYNPGTLVRPLTAPPTVQSAPTNGDFEAGDTGWTKDPGWSINQVTAFTGTWSAQYAATGAPQKMRNTNQVPVTPGMTITASCMVAQGAASSGNAGAQIQIWWLDAAFVQLAGAAGFSQGNQVTSGSGGEWKISTVTGTAPVGAVNAVIVVFAFTDSASRPVRVDAVRWDYTFAVNPNDFIFKAIQTDAGFSGSAEPVWPTVLGGTVVDNAVTWEAVLTSRVIYEAVPILKSGPTEPIFPTAPGSLVADNTVVFEATAGLVTDPKCPQSKVVVIAASKVFAASDDIISFSATVNPLDWSTADDAGYLPFGLNLFGSNPVAAMGLYRSNLVALNAEGFQMWQVDQDPANMAFLDGVPVGSEFHRALQPLMNDLLILSDVGVRDLGIAAASTNLQTGGVGEPIDPLIKAEIADARANGYDPIGLFWPAAGQYWVIFQERAYVLTINAAKKRTWSRYTFPEAITDWTLLGSDLYLRAGMKVWKLDEATLQDDVHEISYRLLEDGSIRLLEDDSKLELEF